MLLLFLTANQPDSFGGEHLWTIDQIVALLRRVHVEEMLLPLLLQLVLIIVVARIFATLAWRVYQPGVVGEIVAGLVLGPSVLGALFPQLFNWLFHPGLPHVPDTLAD